MKDTRFFWLAHRLQDYQVEQYYISPVILWNVTINLLQNILNLDVPCLPCPTNLIEPKFYHYPYKSSNRAV